MINVPVSISALLIYVYVSGFLNRNLLRIEAQSDDNTNIFTYTGFAYRDGSRLNNNDVNLLVPSTKVEVWNRRANRAFNETPLGDVKFTRQYNLPCEILTLSEFLEGRNNLLQTLITTLNLTQLDWQNFVNDLIDTITSKNPDGTFVYGNSDRRLAITRLTNFINDSRSYQNGNYIPVPGSFIGGLIANTWTNQATIQRYLDELPKALFKQCQAEFIIPLVCQIYPNPVLVDPDTGSPTCEDGYIGVCCLYDTVVETIRPGLERTVKIYKECLENIDKADCLNNTKTFTQSLADATYGQYEGAEFYSLDERAAEGCQTCKNPVSVVYCSDGVPFIIRDKLTWEIALELSNAFQPTDIVYFNSSRAARDEFLRRNSQNSCDNTPTPTGIPLPPTIGLRPCYFSPDDPFFANQYTIDITPDINNNVGLPVEYKFWMNDQAVIPDAIIWQPRQTNSATSQVIAEFSNLNTPDSTLYVTTNYNYNGNSGPDSDPSNEITLTCIELIPPTTPTPTLPTETPTVPTETPTTPTPMPITECQTCNGEGGTPCFDGSLWVRMNWSSEAECNGSPFIGGPLDLYFVFTNSPAGYWIYSSPTAVAQINCSGGQWIFTYTNSAAGLWTVEGILGDVSEMENPCNIVGLSGTGTMIWNLLNGCSGQSTANLSVESYVCTE